jgi:hypothetical protein
MIVTILPELAAWWTAHGAKTGAIYADDNCTYWKVDAEDKDPRCKDAAYINLIIKEQFAVAALTQKKFRAPLYFLRQSGKPINTMNREKKTAVPVSKDREALLELIKHDKNTGLSVGCIESEEAVTRFLRESLASGAGFIMYVLAISLVENFETKSIIRLLENQESGENEKCCKKSSKESKPAPNAVCAQAVSK